MVGKKRTDDLQFFTEIKAQSEDLSMRKAGSAYDPDEILEEQREEELKERLNKVFLDFSKRVEALPNCPLSFDVPFTELAFIGVPNKGAITLTPCKDVLCGLQEWPPFCLSLTDVDIIVFERISGASLREFDMVFVRKDYTQAPVRITTIPRHCLDKIKLWLSSLGTPMVWYSSTMNMQWLPLMKMITTNPASFIEDGGWDAMFGDNNESGDEEGDADDGSDFSVDEDDEDADVSSGGGDTDFSAADDDADESDDASGTDGEGGMSWDELEREADQADKRKDADARAQHHAAPVSKRARR